MPGTPDRSRQQTVRPIPAQTYTLRGPEASGVLTNTRHSCDTSRLACSKWLLDCSMLHSAHKSARIGRHGRRHGLAAHMYQYTCAGHASWRGRTRQFSMAASYTHSDILAVHTRRVLVTIAPTSTSPLFLRRCTMRGTLLVTAPHNRSQPLQMHTCRPINDCRGGMQQPLGPR